MKSVIIIGGGVGGLCTAVRLLNKGFKVTVLEKENTLGGKVNIIKRNKFKFDLTASVLMTPDIYISIFKDIGKDYKKYINFVKLDTLYRVNYYDNTSIDISYDSRTMINTLEDIQDGLSKEYIDFLSESFKKYSISKSNFLDKDMIDIKEVININSMSKLIELKPFSSSSNYISSKISNEKLKNYLIFKSMYIGINPYDSSNLYTLIPAISQLYGLWYIKGGFYEYIRALEKLIYELNGSIKLNTRVDEILIDESRILGVRCKDKVYESNIVICNADYPYAIKNLFRYNLKRPFNKENIDKKELSCSVFVLYLGLNKKYKELKTHNIYINKNFKESIEAPFKGEIPKNLSLYIYYPSHIDESICEDGYSALNIMVRVPNLTYKNINWDENSTKKIRNKIIETLKDLNGLEDIEEHIEDEEYLTPLDLEEKFNAYKGCAFGLSHKLKQTAYLRPHIKSKCINGLYFIGSSTHPGNGASVIIDGSKVLSELIYKDYFND